MAILQKARNKDEMLYEEDKRYDLIELPNAVKLL